MSEPQAADANPNAGFRLSIRVRISLATEASDCGGNRDAALSGWSIMCPANTITGGIKRYWSIQHGSSFQYSRIRRALRRLDCRSPKRFLPCAAAREYYPSACDKSRQIKAASPSAANCQYWSPPGPSISFKHWSRTFRASTCA